MAGSRRLNPAAVAALLRRRWNGGHRRWLDGSGSWPLTMVLGAPTERETAQDVAGVRRWIETWIAAEGSPEHPGELVWAERQWTGLGRQRLPERLLLDGPEQVAAWLGEGDRWNMARDRAARLRSVLAPTVPSLSVGRHFDWLADALAVDFDRLLAVLRWLVAHPSSGLYIRQLPIPGIDTKWVGANRGRLVDLLGQHDQSERGRDGDLYRLAGLRREPDLMRLRILDPALRVAVGGLGDVAAPVEQIAALPLRPARVFIVENLQTGLAFEDRPDAVCFMARGYAVDVFAAIPWLRGRPCHYWGDIDTHGFAILNRLRQHLGNVRSLLMDVDTLLRYRDLWQQEDKPVAGSLERLTGPEQAVLDGLVKDHWGERVRLEQERIDWRYAWEVIVARG